MTKPVAPSRSLTPFSPRDYQLPILKALDSGYKRVVAVMPRRSGKDITALNYMIQQMFLVPGIYYYVFPSYAQAKKVIWDSITSEGKKVLDYFPKDLIISTNSQEMKIKMKTANGRESIFQLVGSDNPDSLRGTNPRGIVFSEYAFQDPTAYQIIRPILTANEGWMLVVSTPFGRNHFFEMAQIAQQSPYWFYYHLTLDDTQHISAQEIEREREEGIMTDDMIQQEYYCFPPGQQVLTPNGLTPIEKIEKDDAVVSHCGRVRKVEGTMARHYGGILYHIHSSGTFEPIVCTGNHPVHTYEASSQSYKWIRASDLTTNHYVCFPKKQITKAPLIDRRLALLIAWYITEGSTQKNAVQFTVGTPAKEEAIEGVLEGWEWSFHQGDTAKTYVINSCALSDFLKANCGHTAVSKRIPLELIAGHEEAVYYELMKGDGCYYKKEHCYSTVSKTLAYQMQHLGHSVVPGISLTISCRPPSKVTFPHGKTYECKQSYEVRGRQSDKGRLIRAKYCVAAPIKKIVQTPYDGKVYNFEVQHDNSYIVGGRAVHNCSWTRGVEGAYYAKYVEKMRNEGRIGPLPHEPGFKVHTAWDIGVRDSTVIIFFQTIGQTVRIIDYYEKSKEGLEHYVKILASKDYQYGRHIAPHDIAVKEWGSGMTRIEKAKHLGIDFVTCSQMEIEDGIETVRSNLSKMWIDEKKCAPLVQALENYRQEWDNKRKVYKPKPLHDQWSHAADCMRYLCVSLPKTRDGLSPEELDKRYYEAVYGHSTTLPPEFQNPVGYGR